MVFSESSWQDCPYNGRITVEYILFYQGRPIDHVTPVPGPVSQSSPESEYNAVYTTGINLSHFRMLFHELLNKYPDIVLSAEPLIIMDSKSVLCMDKNGKDKKHNMHNDRRVNFVRNGEK